MYVFGSRWRGMLSLLYPLQLAMQSTDPLLHQPEMQIRTLRMLKKLQTAIKLITNSSL